MQLSDSWGYYLLGSIILRHYRKYPSTNKAEEQIKDSALSAFIILDEIRGENGDNLMLRKRNSIIHGMLRRISYK